MTGRLDLPGSVLMGPLHVIRPPNNRASPGTKCEASCLAYKDPASKVTQCHLSAVTGPARMKGRGPRPHLLVAGMAQKSPWAGEGGAATFGKQSHALGK